MLTYSFFTGAQKYSSTNEPSIGLRTLFSSHTRKAGGIAFKTRRALYVYLMCIWSLPRVRWLFSYYALPRSGFLEPLCYQSFYGLYVAVDKRNNKTYARVHRFPFWASACARHVFAISCRRIFVPFHCLFAFHVYVLATKPLVHVAPRVLLVAHIFFRATVPRQFECFFRKLCPSFCLSWYSYLLSVLLYKPLFEYVYAHAAWS